MRRREKGIPGEGSCRCGNRESLVICPAGEQQTLQDGRQSMKWEYGDETKGRMGAEQSLVTLY
jgi:hypothetical protein